MHNLEKVILFNRDIRKLLAIYFKKSKSDGSFILNSNQINLDELMGNYDTTSMYASVDSLSVDSLSNQNDLSVFSVPENIHFF